MMRAALSVLGCAALVAAQTGSTPTTASPSPRPPQAIAMGVLPTQPSITLTRQGSIAAAPAGGTSDLYYSFTQPGGASGGGTGAQPVSFSVFLSTGTTAQLTGTLNTAGVVGGTFTPRYTLTGGGVGTMRSITLFANDATVGMASGQVWFVHVSSQSNAALSFNLTVQTVLAPSPAPSPGFTFPLTFGEQGTQTVNGLPLNSYVYYSFNAPTAGSPGFRVELQSLGTTDADLFFSRIAPQGSVFSDELNSQAGGGALDTVTVSPSDVQWLPSGGPYYIKVKAYTACSYTIRVVQVAPSPPPPPFVPTPQPSVGTVPRITTETPFQAVVNAAVPGAGRQCYRFRSSGSSGEFAATVRLMDNLPVNVAVHWAWPANPSNLVIRATSSAAPLPSPMPSSPATVTARVVRTNAQWIGYAGEYFVCAEAGAGVAGPATFRLSVADLAPSTGSPSPRAVTVLPLPADTVLPGASLEWGAYRFYSFDSTTGGSVSFRLLPTRQATGTTGGSIQKFEDSQPVDLSDWWVTRRSSIVVDGHLTLTNGRGQRGYAWLSERKAVWPSFAVTFDFTILTAGAFDNGEGFCFSLHNDPRGTAAEGNVGDGLGLGSGGLMDTDARIRRSVSVCLDTFPGTTGNPYPNTPATKMYTFVSVDGNLTCTRENADRSGCAFNLPDLSIGSGSYTWSIRSERIGATGNDARLYWSITDAYTGVALGNWQTVVPGFAGMLNLGAFSNMALVGFTAGTSTNYYSTHTILSYYWGAREQLLMGASGGNADLYVSTSPPTSPDSFSMADTQSTNPGLDVVRIDPTDSYFRPGGGRYYVAVYCAGPSGCTFTLEAQVGSAFPTMTPTPQFGIPSASPTAAPSSRPEQRLLPVNMTASRVSMLPPQRATYYSMVRRSGYFGPITIYLEQPLPANPSTTPAPTRNPDYVGYNLRLQLAVSQSIPGCNNGIFGGVPLSGPGACSVTRDLLAAAGTSHITLTSEMPAYPLATGEVVYIEVRNEAPADMGASGNVTYRLRIAHDAGPTGSAPADATTPIVIAVVVAGVVIAALVMGGLVVMKRMKHASSAVVTVSSGDSGSSSSGGALSSHNPVPSAAHTGGFAASSPISAASHISMRGLPGVTAAASMQVTPNPYGAATGAPPPPPPVRTAYPASSAY